MNSEELQRQYREQHYVVVKGFYPQPLVADYLAFLQSALASEVAPAFASIGVSMTDAEVGQAVASRIAEDKSLDATVKHLLMGHFPLQVRLSEQIHPLARHLGQSTLLKALLDSEQLYMHMPPMMRYVPPRYTPAAVPAHQDSSYNAHMTEFLTVWTPLVPIDLECGGLIMFEGSQHHRQNVAATSSGWLEAASTENFPRKQLTDLVPGDAVILSPYILHGSAPNISSRIRFSMDLRIFGSAGKSTKHHMNLDTLEVISA